MNVKRSQKNKQLKIYYDYFKDLLTIQDQILENPIYSESYYECLTLIFQIISNKKSDVRKITNSEYVHKIHKLFVCLKSSKITSSKLLREVKITKYGLIQCKKKQIQTEKVLEYVELIPELKLTNELKGKQYKLIFINKKQQSKQVFFDNFLDARKARDYCLINSALNNLKYNLAGFIRFMAIQFNDFLIISMKNKIQKVREEMENLQILEQSQSQTLSFFSPDPYDKNDGYIPTYQEHSFSEIQQINSAQKKMDDQIQKMVDDYLDSILKEQLEFIIQDDFEEKGLNVSILQISEHQKSKYSDNNSITQMYLS